jgi:hypothetical protein
VIRANTSLATQQHAVFTHTRAGIREMLVSAICTFVLGLSVTSQSWAQVIEPPQARVSTAAELQGAVNAAASAQSLCIRPYVIWVENDALIDMSFFIDPSSTNNFLLKIPNCVTLASGRSATVDGGLFYLKLKPRSSTCSPWATARGYRSPCAGAVI